MYYVYKLIDPRDNKPFYIGKGKGNRFSHHEKEAKKGSKHDKCERIRDILEAGLQIAHEIVKEFEKEQDAYDYEEQLIAEIGLHNLTNIAKGGRLPIKPVDEYEGLVNSICNILRKTNGVYKDVTLTLAGVTIDISDKIEPMLQLSFSILFKNRSEEWIIKQFKRNNVNITMA